MVRLSNRDDIKGIIRVWNEAFGDSEKDIRFFLDAHYRPENTVIYDYEGEVASVLFLIEGDMHINGKDYSSYYLYAACTLKKFRGRGMMSEMLEFSKNTAYQRNKYFIALKPAEESLYNYYSKFGYKPVFYTKKLVIDREKSIDTPQIKNNEPVISVLRDNAYKFYNYFKWNKSSVDYAVRHHKYYGGDIVINNNGYFLYYLDNDVLYIKENTFQKELFSDSVNETALKYGAEKTVAELPCGFECGNCEIIKSGMLLPVCDEANILIDRIDIAYLSLTLD